MSFGDRAFGGAMDHGDLLPRRARRLLGWCLLALIVLAPKAYTAMAVRYGERQAKPVVEWAKHLVPSTATTRP